jgi:hypothetical protein
MGMESLIVRRWTRAGEDRLYVKTAGGYTVGYYDRHTGARVLDDEAWCEVFDSAVAAFEISINPPVMATEPPWTDLALNLPAKCVRARATELSDAGSFAAIGDRPGRGQADERAWRLGAEGEIAIAAELDRLPSPWRTLHSVPVGDSGSDIDHVVIGPGGVFTVNAKDRPDSKVWIGNSAFILNGPRLRSVSVNRFEASRATQLLTDKVGFAVPVTGLIAIVGAEKLTPRDQPRDGAVVVVRREDIYRWLSRRPAVLDDKQIDAIYAAARRSTTWV